MSTTDQPPISFAEADDRSEAMRRAIEDWLAELTDLVNEASATQAFQEWLDLQSRFHDYSSRNTLLINQQCPGATKVAGFHTWQNEFDRHVREGERAIWIWAPIIAKRCPDCEHSPSYHEKGSCEFDETPPRDWSKGLVGFKPAPVFDVSQTDGEPLPELETEARGQARGLVSRLLDGAYELGFEVRLVDPAEWSHGDAKGICRHRGGEPNRPLVEAEARANGADLAVTLLHEFAHAELHGGIEGPVERAKREVEAEAVAYVVGRYFGLDPSNSAFYLAAWQGEDAETVQGRLERISSTGERFIDAIED